MNKLEMLSFVLVGIVGLAHNAMADTVAVLPPGTRTMTDADLQGKSWCAQRLNEADWDARIAVGPMPEEGMAANVLRKRVYRNGKDVSQGYGVSGSGSIVIENGRSYWSKSIGVGREATPSQRNIVRMLDKDPTKFYMSSIYVDGPTHGTHGWVVFCQCTASNLKFTCPE